MIYCLLHPLVRPLLAYQYALSGPPRGPRVAQRDALLPEMTLQTTSTFAPFSGERLVIPLPYDRAVFPDPQTPVFPQYHGAYREFHESTH